MYIKVRTNKRERYIGNLDKSSKTFTKNVKESKHLFKKANAWGIDSETFNRILLPENYTIHIFDREQRMDYYISAKDFEKHLVYYHFINDDEDNKTQVFCPVTDFSQLPRL